MHKQHEASGNRNHAHLTRLANRKHQADTVSPEIRTNNLTPGPHGAAPLFYALNRIRGNAIIFLLRMRGEART